MTGWAGIDRGAGGAWSQNTFPRFPQIAPEPKPEPEPAPEPKPQDYETDISEVEGV